MREKYIKFFKKELVFLLILLVVVCFSFGITYSNFVYNSDEFRAVEMFTNKLNFELSEKKLTAKPGNNLFKVNIKSLNNVDSYFKIATDNIAINARYYNNENHIIKANENIDIYLIIYNKNTKDEIVNLDISGGFITNTYDDIKVENGFFEIKDNIEIGDMVTIDNNVFRLLNINNNGTYELLSDIIDDNYNIEGSNGYNQYVNIVNDNDYDMNGIVSKKALAIEDIEKYTKKKIIDYGENHFYSNAYYPVLWSLENNAIIENHPLEEFYERSEGVSNGNYEYAPSIIVKDTTINNNIVFKDNRYKNIFFNSNYLLGTRYQHINSDTAEWGILSVQEGTINRNKLFESNLHDYVVNGNIRLLITVSKDIDLFSKAL